MPGPLLKSKAARCNSRTVLLFLAEGVPVSRQTLAAGGPGPSAVGCPARRAFMYI